MTPQTLIQSSSTSGEIAPSAFGRVDISRYNSGYELVQNMLIAPQGGLYRRMGTYFTDETKLSGANPSTLIPFKFSETDSYALDFGQEYVRFYRPNGVRVELSGTAFEVVSPYDGADTSRIYFTQSADVLYLCHPDYAPHKLSRQAATSWTMEPINFIDGPYLPQNGDDTISITASGLTGSITLTASGTIFEAGHVGSVWRIEESAAAKNNPWTSDVTYAVNDRVISNNSVYQCTAVTIGNWTQGAGYTAGDVVQSNGRLYTAQGSGTAGSDAPVHVAGDKTDGTVTWRFKSVPQRRSPRHEEGTENDGRFTWEYLHGGFGVVKITGFTSSTVVSATVLNRLPNSATGGTIRWREAAFSEVQGWPSCVSFFGERLVFAATTKSPQTMWFSVSGEYENYAPTGAGNEVLDTNGFAVRIPSEERIVWMQPQNDLQVGTEGGEWVVSSSASSKAFAPDNAQTKQQSNFGSSNVRQQRIGPSTLFVLRNGQKLYDMLYSFDIQGYDADNDRSVLSEHLLREGGGIVASCYQQTPNSCWWGLRGDGILVGMTYFRKQEIIAFHRQIIGGVFGTGNAVVESGCSIPDSVNGEDQLCMIVKRTINGTTKRYIEYVAPQYWPEHPQDKEGMHYLDSALDYDQPLNVTAVTNAVPCRVTVLGHNFAVGDKVIFENIGGMVGTSSLKINQQTYRVGTTITGTSFTLQTIGGTDINTTAFTPYTGGGQARKKIERLTGLGHLEGQTVGVLADFGSHPDRVVAGGAITLQTASARVKVGLKYDSKIRTLRVDPNAKLGTGQSQTVRINALSLRLLNSIGFRYGAVRPGQSEPTEFAGNDSIVSFRDPSMPMDSSPAVFTGDFKIFTDNSYDSENRVFFQQSQPYPFNILAIIPSVVLYEKVGGSGV